MSDTPTPTSTIERLRTGMVMKQPEGVHPLPWVIDREFCDAAADEIERLRAWKAEATKALTHWDHVAEPVVGGNAKYLGWFRWDAVAVDLNAKDAEIERLQAENERLTKEVSDQWFALAAVLHTAGPVRVPDALLVAGGGPGTRITRYDDMDCIIFSGRVQT